jgi:hypothetical protein
VRNNVYRILWIVFCLFGATRSQAQPKLIWSVDTVTIRQEGCSAHPDSLVVSFTNSSNAYVSLNGLAGLYGTRWEIADHSSYSSMTIAPGATHDVKLLFTGKGYEYRPLLLILLGSFQHHDTLTILEDLKTYSVARVGTDTLRYHEPTTIGQTRTIKGTYFYATGTRPVVIKNIWYAGDSSMRVIKGGSDTLVPGELGFQTIMTFDFEYSPVAEGSDTMTVFIQGEGCDSVYSFTLTATAESSKQGVAPCRSCSKDNPLLERVFLTTESLRLDHLHGELANYAIYDLLGRLVLAGSTTTGEIPLSQFDAITLFVQVQRATGEVIKLHIQR